MAISSQIPDPRQARQDVQPHQPDTLIYIPDTLANFPWPRALNPYVEECRAESDAWIQRFRVFGPKAQKAFDKCNFGLLAGLAYPRLDRGVYSKPWLQSIMDIAETLNH